MTHFKLEDIVKAVFRLGSPTKNQSKGFINFILLYMEEFLNSKNQTIECECEEKNIVQEAIECAIAKPRNSEEMFTGPIVYDWYPMYGCLLFLRPDGVGWYDLLLICSDEWKFEGRDSSSFVKNHPQFEREGYGATASSFCVMQCGSVEYQEMKRLNDVFLNSLAGIQKNCKGGRRSASFNEQGHQKTPSFICMLWEQTLDGAKYQSRGGTTDVGCHTGFLPRETCWPLIQAFFHYYISLSAADIYHKWELCWELWLREKYLNQLSESPTKMRKKQIDDQCEMIDSIVNKTILLHESGVITSSNVHEKIEKYYHDLKEEISNVAHRIRNKYRLPTEYRGELEPIIIKPPTNKRYRSTSADHYSEEDALKKISAFYLRALKENNDPIQDLVALIEFIPTISISTCCMEHLLYIIGTVEDCLFSIVPSLTDDIAIGTNLIIKMEENVEKYEEAMKRWETMGSASLTPSVCRRSHKLLVRWILACLAHREARLKYGLVDKYSLPINPQDLHCVVTGTKNACEVVVGLIKYLRRWEQNNPIFHLEKSNDETFNFAVRFVDSDQKMQEFISHEREKAKLREEKLWSQIVAKQVRVGKLERKLDASRKRLNTLKDEVPPKPIRKYTFPSSEYYTLLKVYNIANEKYEAEHRVRSDLESQLRLARKPPQFEVNPLPENNRFRAIATFYINMPLEIEQYSKLVFTAQSMLKKCNKNTFYHKTWVKHYNAHSGSFQAKDKDVSFFGKNYAIPRYYGPSDVTDISDASELMWYPDFDSQYISKVVGNPFAVDTKETKKLYTEQLPRSFKSFQWMIDYPEDSLKEPTTRGNKTFEFQENRLQGFDKAGFMNLCNLRSFGHLQFHSLINIVHERSIPFGYISSSSSHNNGEESYLMIVSIFLQQLLFQVGTITMKNYEDLTSTNTFIWRSCLFEGERLELLCNDLEDWADDLENNPREHFCHFNISIIALFFAQWDENIDRVSRKLGEVAFGWAKDVNEELEVCEMTDPNYVRLRVKECLMYGYALYCWSKLNWGKGDAIKCLTFSVKFYDGLRFLDVIKDDQMKFAVRSIKSSCSIAISRRVEEMHKEIKQSTRGLDDVVRLVYGQASTHIKWEDLTVEGRSLSCFKGASPDNQENYLINIASGCVMCNGNLPGQLPPIVKSNYLYSRSFGDLNFEVARVDNTYKTLRKLNGYFYQFQVFSSDIKIFEIGSDGDTLELVDIHTNSSLWQCPVPCRLKRSFSFWFNESCGIGVFRDISYKGHSVYFISQLNDSGKCYEVLPHQQNLSSRELNDIIDTYFYLCHNPVEYFALSKFIKGQPCFESHKSIFETLQHDGSSCRQITLPMFSLSFKINEDGTLDSIEFDGFRLCESSLQELRMPQFSQYFILEPKDPLSLERKKMIIPKGTIQQLSCDSFAESTVIEYSLESDSIGYYQYEFHPRLEEWKTPSMESRLYLATIYTASDTLFCDPTMKMTCGEMALELLSRCYIDRPFSVTEEIMIQSLFFLGGKLPSIRILCDKLIKCSRTLEGLHVNTDFYLKRTINLTGMNNEVLGISWNQALRNASVESVWLNNKNRLPLNVLRQGFDGAEWGLVKTYQQSLSNKLKFVNYSTPCLSISQKGPTSRFPLKAENCDFNFTKQLEGRLSSFACEVSKSEHDPFPLNDDPSNETIKQLKMSWKYKGQLTRKQSMCTLAQIETFYSNITKRAESLLIAIQSCCTDRAKKLSPSFNLLCLANRAPTSSLSDLMRASLSKKYFDFFNPYLLDSEKKLLQKAVIHLMELFVLEDKMKRLLYLLRINDRSKVCQELQCVRSWDTMENPRWLLFEVENTLQIRPEQFQIADYLLKHPNCICQLNMGLGKTRVILPMIILKYAEQREFPRVHILRSLFSEFSSYIQSSLGDSLIRVQILEHPFQRDVKLTAQSISMMKRKITHVLNKAAVQIVTKEHRLSMILKYFELKSKNEHALAGQWHDYIEKLDTIAINILDESDALLHHKELLVYAIGVPGLLPSVGIRSNVIQAVLHVLYKPSERLKSWIKDSSILIKDKDTSLGSFQPIFLLPDQSIEQIDMFHREIFKDLVDNSSHTFQWFKECKENPEIIELICKGVCDFDKSIESCLNKSDFTQEHWTQLCVLRGLLAYRLLTHGLSLRYRVEYGLDIFKQRKKKVAIPYRASDVPTERSEFSHPDKCLMVTILSYYYNGLSNEAIFESVECLLKLGLSAQEYYYNEWFSDIGGKELVLKDESFSGIDKAEKLDLTNQKQFRFLCESYRKCRSTINFWINYFVVPVDMTYYPQKISSSSWNLPGLGAIGFSGTKDLSPLMPLQVRQSQPDSNELRSTDAIMLEKLLVANLRRISNDEDQSLHNNQNLPKWQTIIRQAVNDNVAAIIDTGSLLAGATNAEVANYLVENPSFDNDRFYGVQYFEMNCKSDRKLVVNGQWMILEAKTGLTIPRHQYPRKDSETFIIFDDARCRGSDKKMDINATAALTLGVKMTKDVFMQGAGRLRQLGQNQKILVYCPDIICDSLDGFTIQDVINWIISNTTEAITHGLVTWAEQGLYFHSTQNNHDHAMLDEESDVEKLYGPSCSESPIPSVIKGMIKMQNLSGNLSNDNREIENQIMKTATTFGATVEVMASNCTEECERELEIIKEKESEVERQLEHVTPVSEGKWDYCRMIGASSVIDLMKNDGHDVVEILSIQELFKTEHYLGPDMESIQWNLNIDQPKIFVTRNFIKTINEGKTSDIELYARQVTEVVVFSDETVLIVSEREADGYLSCYWQSQHISRSQVRSKLVHRDRLLGPVVANASIGNHNVDMSDWSKIALQLLNGECQYHLEDPKFEYRERILKNILQNEKSTIAIEALVKQVRGKSHNFECSDLAERICRRGV